MVDITNLETDKSPFTMRKPTLKIWHIMLVGILVAVSVLLAAELESKLLLNLVTVIIAISVVTLLYIAQNKTFDDKTATEFQALVFSGTMRSNTLLTAIVYRDGSVFYLDPRYIRNFEKASANHSLDQFLTTLEVPQEDKLKIYDAIRGTHNADIDFNFKTDKNPVALKIGVFHLHRPEGFVNISIMKK
jgi:hypothetical protein